jgi:membrane protein
MKRQLKEAYELVRDTVTEWSQDRVPRMGAALACYSAFSVAPLVLLVIAVASRIFTEDQVREAILGELTRTFGEPVARTVAGIVTNAEHTGSATTATVVSILTLLFGASGVFGELQDSLNSIWKVQPKPGRAWLTILRERFFSFTMVLGTGFLLLVSLTISTALSVMGAYFTHLLPGGAGLWHAVNWVVSFVFIMSVFALIFKEVPDVKVAWRDVWVGAALTALLFTLGKYLLAMYLGLASTTSAYGAAGSLVAFLLWVYYSAQILLFGAEFTRIYARKRGDRAPPADNAVKLTREALARQGMPRDADVAAATRVQEAAARVQGAAQQP